MQTRAHIVREARELSGGCFVLVLDGPFPAAHGGQFCMLRAEEDWPVLLPRPFSYFDVEPGEGGFASFFGKAIGPGTEALRAVSPGAKVVVSGPLGRAFPDGGDTDPICIAGGVGLAPFLLWAKARRSAGRVAAPILYGGASRDVVVGMEDFAGGAQTFHLATDDGTLGFHGNVLDLYRSLCASGVVDASAPVYCCGPEAMMEAVAEHCATRGVQCLVSLETYMACGYGVCNGCTVRVHSRGRFDGQVYAKSCITGPVFDAEELVW